MNRRWLPLLRASYTPGRDTVAWLEGLADAALPLMDCGAGIIVAHFTFSDAREFETREVVFRSGGDNRLLELFQNALGRLPRSLLPERTPHAAIHHTLSEYLLARARHSSSTRGSTSDRVFEDLREESGFLDALLTRVDFEHETGGLLLAAPSHDKLDPPIQQRARWAAIAQHIRSGAEIASRLANPTQNPVIGSLEAAETATAGAFSDAETGEPATPRRPTREDWNDLVAGRHSVVDEYTEHLRARHYVLLKNPPAIERARRLSAREAAAIETFARTASSVDISTELGVAESTVRQYLRSAMMKLGIRHRSELLQIAFALDLVRRKTTASNLRPPTRPAHHPTLRELDEDLSILSIPLVPSSRVTSHLTDAEREICRFVMLGWSSEHIAKHRDTSERTVANQLASIFRKLEITDRFELAHRLLGARKDGSHIID